MPMRQSDRKILAAVVNFALAAGCLSEFKATGSPWFAYASVFTGAVAVVLLIQILAEQL